MKTPEYSADVETDAKTLAARLGILARIYAILGTLGVLALAGQASHTNTCKLEPNSILPSLPETTVCHSSTEWTILVAVAAAGLFAVFLTTVTLFALRAILLLTFDIWRRQTPPPLPSHDPPP